MQLQEAHNLFLSALATYAPRITDYSQGSIVYTLTRAMAAATMEVWNRVEQLEVNYLLGQSQGQSLSDLGTSLGCPRYLGSLATGGIQVSNILQTNVSIPAGLVLTHPETKLQFSTKNTSETLISSYYETRIQIESIDRTSIANLPANSELISPQYPSLNFVVGDYRGSDGVICGDLKGGSDPESDAVYTERLLRCLTTGEVTTGIMIERQLGTLGDISYVKVETIQGGIVKIWVGSGSKLTVNRLLEINSYAQQFLPAGTVSSTHQLEYVAVNFKIRLFVSDTSDVNSIVIRQSIQDYITSLKLHQPLVTNDLLKYLSSRLNVSMEIISPLEDIYLQQLGQSFIVESVEVIYDT